jgi:hypothetical protein
MKEAERGGSETERQRETDGTVMALQHQHAKEIHAFLESIHACSRLKKQPGVREANYPDHAEVLEPFLITVGEFT